MKPRFYVEHCTLNHRFYVVDGDSQNQVRWAGSFGEMEVSRMLIQTICDSLNTHEGKFPSVGEHGIYPPIPAD